MPTADQSSTDATRSDWNQWPQSVFLLGTLEWLSKIKGKGSDGSILILLDVVSFIINILAYFMYQVDLN